MLHDCDPTATSIILSDPNVPKVGELSFDMNLMSPIAECYQMDPLIIQSAEKLIEYLSK